MQCDLNYIRSSISMGLYTKMRCDKTIRGPATLRKNLCIDSHRAFLRFKVLFVSFSYISLTITKAPFLWSISRPSLQNMFTTVAQNRIAVICVAVFCFVNSHRADQQSLNCEFAVSCTSSMPIFLYLKMYYLSTLCVLINSFYEFTRVLIQI